MSYTVKGYEGITRLKDTREWSPSTGTMRVIKYVGDAESIKDYFDEIKEEGEIDGLSIASVQENYNGGYGELIIRCAYNSSDDTNGYSEDIEIVWELTSEVLNKPIETHRIFDALSGKDKSDIYNAVRKNEPNPVGSDIAKTLYAYYAHQINDYVAVMFRLTKNIIISSKSVAKCVYNRVGQVWKTDEVLGNTQNVKYTNEPLLGVLRLLPRWGTSNGEWEWLYLGPQLKQVAKNRYQLTQTWVGAERWADIYVGGTFSPKYEE